MQPDQIITLTSDFGYEDPFAGIMKGVILKINPHARIVDLTHGIRPYDIREAALTIGMNYSFFPENTIHVVVVDPEVGSGRRPLLVAKDNHYFIGPDNGVFSMIYNIQDDSTQVIHILSAHYFLLSDSPTFQGRDVFAPAAAWLSSGISITKFGEPIADYLKIHMPLPHIQDDGTLKGEVINTDRFGNAITNVTKFDIDMLHSTNPGHMLKILFKEKDVPFRGFYSEVKDNNLYSLINSSGYLELFMYRENAFSEYSISIGDIVEILLK